MIISIKKYICILKTLKTLLDRPYLADISENNGITTFTFVKGNKIYEFKTIKIDDERILN